MATYISRDEQWEVKSDSDAETALIGALPQNYKFLLPGPKPLH